MGKLSKSFGGITRYQETNQGITFQSEECFGLIEFWNDSICRVRLSNEPLSAKHSYAVCSDKTKCKVNISDESDQLKLKGKSYRVELSKKDSKLSFIDHKSTVINKDAIAATWNGTEATVYKSLNAEEKFIGLGEKVGPLNRRGHAYSNWNTDKFAYDTEQDPLYLSTPFFIGINGDHFYGIFLDNTHKSTFNFGASTDRFSWFSVEDGEIDYYFIHGNSIADIIKNYTWLTGRIELPPKWSLGFQQCRYSYYPESEVEQIATTFRDKNIPCDVIYLDIHYMEEFKVFSFDKNRFPNPERLVKSMAEKGIKTAVILDPGIKVLDGYNAYESGIEQDVFLRYPDDELYTGEVWPGKSHFPDFTDPKARNWWQSQLRFYTEMGILGYWNDMNEPAAWGQCLPNIVEFHYEGEATTHREGRNVYGMQMTRATNQGAQNQLNNQRPFILTRAGFSGIQRYAAIWTGDNVSSDEHLMLGVRLVNSLGLTGISFCGNDVGGFAGDASPELYARWISIGAFQPFFRAHSVVDSKDAEPWSFGEEVEQIARNYISLRYKLMPLIYSLFWESTRNGMPINRSLALNFPLENNTFKEEFQHQFMLGDQLMIVPVESYKDYVNVWLPPGNWYNFWTGEKYAGNREIVLDCPIWKLPVLVKAGSIIPMQKLTQNLDQTTDELHLHVYGQVNGTLALYEDNGNDYGFKNGNFSSREIQMNKNGISISKQEGQYSDGFSKLKIFCHGFKVVSATINDKPIMSQSAVINHVKSIEGVDSLSQDKGSDMEEGNIDSFTLPLGPEKIDIRWAN